MKLVIVSGLSGSGKSIALNTLEDSGYYCIDNLPVSMIEAFIHSTECNSVNGTDKVAIGIDSRTTYHDSLTNFSDTLKLIREQHIEWEILFLKADQETLLKRFSETRRRHPLTNPERSLAEAIQLEQDLLDPIAEHADLIIDTSRTNVHQLRDLVRARVGNDAKTLSLFFQSFGFKHGLPLDTDFVFDVRCLPNPHWEPTLRSQTGRDEEVAEFLQKSPEVQEYINDIVGFLHRWVPRFEAENRTYLSLSIGCTGGQHRSVYIVENIARHFRATPYNILVRHRELL